MRGLLAKRQRWLELCKNFILTANQAQIAALRSPFGRKRIGSFGSFGNCLKIRPPKRGAKPRARQEMQTLQIGCMSWIKFEPILRKIPTLNFDCQPAFGGQETKTLQIGCLS